MTLPVLEACHALSDKAAQQSHDRRVKGKCRGDFSPTPGREIIALYSVRQRTGELPEA